MRDILCMLNMYIVYSTTYIRGILQLQLLPHSDLEAQEAESDDEMDGGSGGAFVWFHFGPRVSMTEHDFLGWTYELMSGLFVKQ